jgi:hypothetical protein
MQSMSVPIMSKLAFKTRGLQLLPLKKPATSSGVRARCKTQKVARRAFIYFKIWQINVTAAEAAANAAKKAAIALRLLPKRNADRTPSKTDECESKPTSGKGGMSVKDAHIQKNAASRAVTIPTRLAASSTYAKDIENVRPVSAALSMGQEFKTETLTKIATPLLFSTARRPPLRSRSLDADFSSRRRRSFFRRGPCHAGL